MKINNHRIFNSSTKQISSILQHLWSKLSSLSGIKIYLKNSQNRTKYWRWDSVWYMFSNTKMPTISAEFDVLPMKTVWNNRVVHDNAWFWLCGKRAQKLDLIFRNEEKAHILRAIRRICPSTHGQLVIFHYKLPWSIFCDRIYPRILRFIKLVSDKFQ